MGLVRLSVRLSVCHLRSFNFEVELKNEMKLKPQIDISLNFFPDQE